MTAPLAYLNGRFVPFAEAGLPLHDAGFVSGATVVDNARTYGRKLFRWPDHLARFRRDCAACYIPLAATDADLTAVAEELVSRNAAFLPPDGEFQVVTFATPGPLGAYLGESANGPPTLGMVTYPVPAARNAQFMTEGVRLAVAGFQGAADWHLLPPRVKHRSRLFWHVAERTVNDPASRFYNPGAVPVVLSEGGIGDTAIGAILVVSRGAVHPPVTDTVQESITLKVVLELCRGLGIPVYDSPPLDLRDFSQPVEPRDEQNVIGLATEVLLAGTGFGVAGVREFALAAGVARAYPWPGPVYARLRAAWDDLTRG
jgi:branched-subunit amino acid aminotransferase/4-amino-4-deoxychorismate lyase